VAQAETGREDYFLSRGSGKWLQRFFLYLRNRFSRHEFAGPESDGTGPQEGLQIQSRDGIRGLICGDRERSLPET